MNEELKPCPFCGRDAIAIDDGSAPCAMCPDRKCAGGRVWIRVATWNRRAPSPAAARVAELEREVAALRGHLRRVVGLHIAPSDCYSTGPQFGDARDSTCPSCDALRHLAALAPRSEA